MPVDTKLMLICLIVMAAGLVLSVLRVLGAWVEHHVSRHDLIAESKRRRLAYHQALADRDRELSEQEEQAEPDSVVIEEDQDLPLAA